MRVPESMNSAVGQIASSVVLITCLMTGSANAVQMLQVVVEGHGVAYLVDPGGSAAGMASLSAPIEENISGSRVDSSPASTAIAVEEPMVGTYSLSLSGPYPETLRLDLSWFDAVTAQSSTRTYRALYKGAPLFLDAVFDPVGDPAFDIETDAGEPVIAAKTVSELDTVVFNWPVSSSPAVEKYRVYRRPDAMPVFEQVTETADASYDTGDSRLSVSGDRFLYVVTAVSTTGNESLIEQVLDNDIVTIAEFEADRISASAPATVQFSDLSFGEPDQWSWDFDSDGTVDSTEQNPTHVYNATGLYSVTLTVDGPYGRNAKTKAGYVEVVDAGCLQGQDSVTISNVDYPSGAVVTCEANLDIQAGPNVKVSAGAVVTYSAPQVGLLSGFRVELGGLFHIGSG